MSTARLTDSLGRHWIAGAPLGYGTWGWSQLLTDAAGREGVLKRPYTEQDLLAGRPGLAVRAHGAVPPEHLVTACRLAAEEHADRLQRTTLTFAAPLEATIERLDDLRIGLVFPRLDTVQHRLAMGWPLGDALAVVHQVAQLITDSGRVHGNLRPSNILLDDRGQIFLADEVIGALTENHAYLVDLADQTAWLPPEARRSAFGNRSSPATPHATWDTWALSQLLFAAVWSHPHRGEAGTTALAPAVDIDGLERSAVAALKRAIEERAEADEINPRFRARVAERLGAMLGRGLSRESEPSPPCRFSTHGEPLGSRADEVLDLLHPRVLEVGRLLWPIAAQDGVFTSVGSTAEVTFGVAVSCTRGIVDPADLACEVQLAELTVRAPPAVQLMVRPPPAVQVDRGGATHRLTDLSLSAETQRGGRLRFQVTLPQVAPGRYRVQVGFNVRGSDGPGAVGSGELEVRAPPGYVASTFAGSEAPPPPFAGAAAPHPAWPSAPPAPAPSSDLPSDFEDTPDAEFTEAVTSASEAADPGDDPEETGTVSEGRDSAAPGPVRSTLPPLTRSSGGPSWETPSGPRHSDSAGGPLATARLTVDPRAHDDAPPHLMPDEGAAPVLHGADGSRAITARIVGDPVLFSGLAVVGCLALVGLVSILLRTCGQ